MSSSRGTVETFVKLTQIILGRSKAVMFVVLVLAAFGVHAYISAPQSIFPAMDFARIDVVADAGDLTAARVRTSIAEPLETAFGTLPSATRVRATSTQGSAEILIDFDTHTDARVDLQAVNGAISSLAPLLPAARRIDAVIVNANSEPVVSYGLTSRILSQAALAAFITTRVVPEFAGTPGLARTSVVGGPPIEYRVELQPAALAAYGLSASDVSAAIGAATTIESVGTVVGYHQRSVLLVDAGIHDPSTLAAIAIPLKGGGTVALGALGAVRLGVGAVVDQAAVNGVHAVVLNAYPLAGADVVRLARSFAARLDGVRDVLPADVTIVEYWNQTRLIVDSQRSLRDAIVLGGILALIVILLFLRSVRMTLVAGAVIPLALAIAILVLERSGQSLNLMSVGGLAVAVGLIIDDAIVVIEAIERAFSTEPEGRPPAIIGAAVGRIAGPMAASTLTTVVVFVPLGLLSGVTGFFFRALAFTLAASLIVSLVLTVCVAPIIAGSLLRHGRAVRARVDRIGRCYEPILRWALGHRIAVYAAGAVVLVATVVLLAQLPSDFLPRLDEGEFEIKYLLPSGATVADSDAAAGRMERVVLADPDVRSVGRLTGIDTNGFTPTQANSGTLRVALQTGPRAGYDRIADRLRERLNATVPAADLDFHQLLEDQIDDLSGAPQPVEVTLAGPDQARLIELADKTSDAISGVAGVVDAYDGVVYDDPSIAIAPLGPRLAGLGIDAASLGDAVSARTQGAPAAHIAAERTTIPVNVRVAGDAGPVALGDVALFTRDGGIPLSGVARVSRPTRVTDIDEENGRLVDRVTANIEGASLSAVIAGVQRALARAGMPPGYSAAIGGTYETQQASFHEFASVIAIAILLVFCVMLGTFGSFRLPLVILCAVPLALIGVAAILFVTGTPINVSSFMGLLLLVGIVVKNGILLIDAANRRRAAGDDVVTALVAAGSLRVRPIVMTTLAAIGGLTPLALGLGAGTELERPLAIAVIGGLSTATAFTLVLIPVLYATLLPDRRRTSAGPAVVATALVLAFVVFVPHVASAQATAPPHATDLAFAQVDLDAAERLAVVASPDVNVARATLDGAAAALGQARSSRGLSLVGSYVETPQGAPGGTIAQRLTQVGGQATLGDLAAYEPLVAQAAATLRAAQSDEVSAERSERVKVVGLYYDALKARAVRRARADAIDSAQQQLAAARTRYDAGDAPRLDIVRAQVALARAQGDLASAVADDGSATDALAREIGRPMSLFDATATGVPAVASTVPEPAAAVAVALARRADLRSADSNVSAAAAGVRAARTAIASALTLGAGYARGTDSGFPTSGPTVSAVLSIPLGDDIGARVHAQAALLAAARARRESIARAIALAAGSAARTAAATIDAERAAAAALAAASDELAAATLGYANGAATSLDASTARASYVQSVVDALRARYDRLAAQAVLGLELGS